MLFGKNSLSILFADDDAQIRSNIATTLNLMFLYVYEASDGLEAIRLYQEKKPDILILDNIMPNMNGIDVVKKIRQNDTETKIIILTANSDLEYILDAVKLNLAEYIIKPVIPDKFLKTLQEIISQLKDKDKIYINKEFTWNISTKQLISNDSFVKLTKNETKLLSVLASSLHNPIESEYLSNIIWDDKILKDHQNSLRNLINKLHKKTYSEIIESVYGSGYKIKLEK